MARRRKVREVEEEERRRNVTQVESDDSSYSSSGESASSSSGSDSGSSIKSQKKRAVRRQEPLESVGDSESSDSGDGEENEEKEEEKEADGGMGMAVSDSEDDWEPKKENKSGSDSDSDDDDDDSTSHRLSTKEDTGRINSVNSRPWPVPSANSVVGESEDESEEAVDERATAHEVQEAKWLLWKFISNVPVTEGAAIRRGLIPSGPPIENPVAHSDGFARKFRWPQHIRNLRNTDFSQDLSEILEDYEVLAESQQTNADHAEAEESPLAQVPRPMLALAAEAVRRSSRKRKRAAGGESQEDSNDRVPSHRALLNIARIGGRFGEQFIESLLSANGKALQGLGESLEDYDPRCWTSLPMSRKPVANWRFVLEHLRKSVRNSEAPGGGLCPPLKQDTLARITNRLKQHYGLAWQQDDALFKVIESQPRMGSFDSGDNTGNEEEQIIRTLQL